MPARSGLASTSSVASSQQAASSSLSPRSSPVGATSSILEVSGIPTVDPASARFLGRTAKTLTRQLGPVAGVYLEEAVRQVTPGAAFSMAYAPRLVEQLANQLDGADRAQFLKVMNQG
jgi:hypothetical protein